MQISNYDQAIYLKLIALEPGTVMPIKPKPGTAEYKNAVNAIKNFIDYNPNGVVFNSDYTKITKCAPLWFFHDKADPYQLKEGEAFPNDEMKVA